MPGRSLFSSASYFLTLISWDAQSALIKETWNAFCSQKLGTDFSELGKLEFISGALLVGMANKIFHFFLPQDQSENIVPHNRPYLTTRGFPYQDAMYTVLHDIMVAFVMLLHYFLCLIFGTMCSHLIMRGRK